MMTDRTAFFGPSGWSRTHVLRAATLAVIAFTALTAAVVWSAPGLLAVAVGSSLFVVPVVADTRRIHSWDATSVSVHGMFGSRTVALDEVLRVALLDDVLGTTTVVFHGRGRVVAVPLRVAAGDPDAEASLWALVDRFSADGRVEDRRHALAWY